MFDDLSLDDLAERIAGVEQKLAAQKQLLEELKMTVIDRMERDGLASTVTADGKRITVVRSQVSRWDADILKDILAPLELWERVRVLREEIDEAALERLVDAGQVEITRLEPALTVTQRKPYPRISAAREQADA